MVVLQHELPFRGHEQSFRGLNGQNRRRAMPMVFHHQGEAAVNFASPLMTQQMDVSGLSDGRTLAVGAHLGPHPRRQVAARFVIVADRKGGHQFFHSSLTKGASDLVVGTHHQLIKFVAAVLAVVFIKGHSSYPPYLQLFNL
jgi:hypothetical protein